MTAYSPQVALYGSSVVLSCQIDSSSPFKVQWLKGSTALGPVMTRVGLVNVTYTIPTVIKEDQGTYSCFASNAGGALSGNVELVVKGKVIVLLITSPVCPSI